MGADIDWIRNFRLIKRGGECASVIEADGVDFDGTTWGSGKYHKVLEELQQVSSLTEQQCDIIFPMVDYFNVNCEMDNNHASEVYNTLKASEEMISENKALLHTLYLDSTKEDNTFSDNLHLLLLKIEHGYVMYINYS